MKNVHFYIMLGLLLQSVCISSTEPKYRSLNEIQERQESSGNCCNRKTKIGVGLLTIMGAVATIIGVTLYPQTPTPNPSYEMPEGEGPKGSTNYVRFVKPGNHYIYAPTCSLLNSSSPGMEGCPSTVPQEFGAFDKKYFPGTYYADKKCITDKQVKTDMPKYCAAIFGKRQFKNTPSHK